MKILNKIILTTVILLSVLLVSCGGNKINKVELDISDVKTEYLYGDKINLDNLIIVITYDNDSTEEVKVTSTMVSGFDSTKIGKQTITVKYDGLTKNTFEVTIKELDNVNMVISAIDKLPSVNNIKYEDKISVEAARLLVNGLSEENQKRITNIEKLEELEEKIKTIGETVKSFEIVAPDKIVYGYKEALDLKGATIIKNLHNGEIETIEITSEMVTGFDSNTLGTKTIKVTYEGLTDNTFDVEIVINEVYINELLEKIQLPNTTTNHVELPTVINGLNISWNSSHPNVISDAGIVSFDNEAYTECSNTVILTAKIGEVQKQFTIKVYMPEA